MSRFAAIELSRLPEPEVVETLDFDAILDAIKADFAARSPEHVDALDFESEPLVKLMEAVSYREIVIRARINDAAKALMIAYANDADLDHIAARFGVERQLVAPADPAAVPPLEAVYESNERLRRRVQLAPEAFSVAGPVGAYLFHGLTASVQVKDVSAVTPTPGDVTITVLGAAGAGVPDQATLDAVADRLNADEVRPLGDRVTVQAAEIVAYQIDAALTIGPSLDPETVRDAARAAVAAYAEERHRLGHDVALSGLFAALHRDGVRRVALSAPMADIAISPFQAAHCTAIVVSVEAVDD